MRSTTKTIQSAARPRLLARLVATKEVGYSEHAARHAIHRPMRWLASRPTTAALATFCTTATLTVSLTEALSIDRPITGGLAVGAGLCAARLAYAVSRPTGNVQELKEISHRGCDGHPSLMLYDEPHGSQYFIVDQSESPPVWYRLDGSPIAGTTGDQTNIRSGDEIRAFAEAADPTGGSHPDS